MHLDAYGAIWLRVICRTSGWMTMDSRSRSRSRSRSPPVIPSPRQAVLEQHGRLLETFSRVNLVISTLEAAQFLMSQSGNHVEDWSLHEHFPVWAADFLTMSTKMEEIRASAQLLRRDLLIGLARWGERQLDMNRELPVPPADLLNRLNPPGHDNDQSASGSTGGI